MFKQKYLIFITLLILILVVSVGCNNGDNEDVNNVNVNETLSNSESEEANEEATEEATEEANEEETIEDTIESEPVDLGELSENLLGNTDFVAELSENQPDGTGFVDTENTWTFHTNNGAEGVAEMDGTLIKIDPTNINSPAYGIQLIQGMMTIEADTTYEITITAKAEADRDISIKVGGIASKSWAGYAESTVNLTTEMTTSSFEFTMNGTTDEEARFEIWFAQSEVPVWIESISLKKYEATTEAVEEEIITVAPGENMIVNGNWATWMGDEWSGQSTGELVETDNTMSMGITAVGQASYSAQIFQEGLIFKNGSTYRVTFDAVAQAPKTAYVNVGRALPVDPWWTAYAATKTFVFEPEMQTFTFDFLMEEETYDVGKMVFELGTVEGDDTLTEVTLSNIIITEVE